MGTDIYAYGFVGIPVESNALLVDQVDAHETCSKGHVRQEGTGAFCDQDGDQFRHRTQRVSTEGFRKLCTHLDLEEGEDVLHLLQALMENGIIWESTFLHTSRAKRLMILTTGDRLSTGSHRDREQKERIISWTEAEIQEQFEKVRELAKVLGLTGAPRFYLLQEVSR